MSKPSKNKRAWSGGAWLWVCASLFAPAQGATVAEIIARMKQQKEQDSLGRGPNTGPETPLKEQGMPKLPTTPLLWSLIGVDDDLQAVLVYQGRAYVAQANMPRSRMGPWWIESVSAQGVVLQLHAKPKAAPLVLAAPERGAAIEPYAQSLGVYRAPAVMAMGASALSQSVRMNSASSAFSALWTSKETEPLLLGTLPSDPQSGPLPDGAARPKLPADLNPGLVPKRP
jgi:hypothetical protein